MPEVLELLRAVLPEGVALASAEGSDLLSLWPGESLPGAVPARQAEFAAGRSAARRAMVALSLPAAAIPMGADRAPIWPAGVIGSISHCAGACLAAVARDVRFRGLGLDIEPLQPLEAALWPIILRPEEMLELAALPMPQQGLHALRIFVAKEAAYKAQYGRSHQMFDFQTLRIVWQDQGFSAIFCADVPPFAAGFQIDGALVADADFAAAFCCLPIV